MDIPNRDQLLDKVERFCTRHDIAETRFGRDSVSNPNFIRGLRDGVSPTLDTLIEVQKYMERVDAEAATRAKLDASPPPGERDEEDVELPFVKAPAPPAGAPSSPTSSSMNGHPSPREASRRSPSCSDSSGQSGTLAEGEKL